ncbi:MAG: sugar phosphate nucleotidyltransferase [Nanoarchaeota archaeon]
MKALILAGGRGSRLNEFTKEKNKSMIKLFEKPIIEYNLDHAVEAGVSEIIIVVGYKKEEIIRYFGKEYKGIKVRYIIQNRQKGVVHAIECSKEALGNSDFMLMLADEVIIRAKIKEMIKKFKKGDLFAVCGVTLEKEKSSIRKTYSAMVNESGRVFRLIEKPRFPINNIKGTGHCIFKNEILEYIKKTPISMKRFERELVDMIQESIDDGKEVYVYPLTDNYVNVNNQEDFDLAKELINKDNPKVLIIHPQMKYFGGAELLIVEMANWLTKRGIRNDILTLSKSKEVEDNLINTEIIIPKNKIDILPSGFKDIKDIIHFIKICRKELKKIIGNYDVINFHNFPVTWTLFPKRKPCIWMLNEPPNLWSKPHAGFALKTLNKIRNYLDREIVRNSIDLICVADEFNKERAIIRYKKIPRVIYYGVNYNFFSKGNSKQAKKKWNINGKFVVVQSGILTENKNQLDSIITINKIKTKIPNILLILAGTPEEKYKKKLDDYIKNNHLEKYVLFAGNLNRRDLRDLYKSCDVGLFPVKKQGGWLAPFELLCSGNPIIVSEEMGASSVIKENNLGIVTKNYSEELLKVYNNVKESKKKAGKASLFVKKNLGWDIFTDKMIKAYRDVWREYK